MIKKFIPFGEPKISKEEIDEVVKTLKSGWIGMGPKVLEFEQAFKDYIGCRYVVSTNSCTAGLHLALKVNDIGKGDEVITSPLTYAATGNVIIQTGAKPVFADIDLDSYNIDPREIEKKITTKTKAIIPVHYGGLPCDMDEIYKIAKKHKLIVVEDAAHDIGARYRGKRIGNSQNLVVFSLYPNKNITSCEGGMIGTNNRKHVERLKILRSFGLSNDAWKRFRRKRLLPSLVVEPGYKYYLTDLQATLGIEQLKKVEKWQKIRQKYARYYDSIFKKIPGVYFQKRPKDFKMNRHSLYLYTLRIDPRKFRISRDEIVKKLLRENIGATVHYYPLHLHPYYKKTYQYKKGMFPICELVTDNIFTIPLTPHLETDKIKHIGEIVKELLVSSLVQI